MTKRIINSIFFLFVLLGFSNLFAQDVFTKFEKDKNINSVIVNKKMFEMMANVKVETTNPEEKVYFDLIKKLNHLRVFNTQRAEQKKQLSSTANNYVKANNLKEIINKKDSESTIVIFVDNAPNSKIISELVMINESTNETILVLITGSFTLKELTSLTKKMNLPLGNTLDKL